MLVDGLVIASEELLQASDIEKPLDQVRAVAHLPGILKYSIAMPDIHWGYGFPIGGVAAMDIETGVISPGGVGYDINCGVRLAIIDEPFKNLSDKTKRDLLKEIFSRIPSGVGRNRNDTHELTNRDYSDIAKKGVLWSIEQGYGSLEDVEHTESKGCIEGADPDSVSDNAKSRGKSQLGTIGSGNHFVEIGEVQELFLPDIAKAWGVKKGSIYILIHSGSRGFGHQICQDTLDDFVKKGYAEGLPDKQLCAAPIQSPDGKNYFRAMAMAANYAFNNRQQILHAVRKSFQQILNITPENIRLLYDVCHNIAKFENHIVDGQMKKVCVHRKGATRAYGPGATELAPIFQKTGQPVLVPGDMGRKSHLMVGQGNPITWCSSCHGAGRFKSRMRSEKDWKGKNLIEHMEKNGVLVMANSIRTISEEMPDAYKDVDMVVKAVQSAGLAKMVASLKPHLVVKG